MRRQVGRAEIEHAYELLRTKGPATAYDYLQQTGQFTDVPSRVLVALRERMYASRAQQRRAIRRAATLGTRAMAATRKAQGRLSRICRIYTVQGTNVVDRERSRQTIDIKQRSWR